ncbi:N-acetylmuramoyl-L-alanine amidase [Clostridium estertheticum]|uniref:N-acetylmuramoyl-L-alanine amidase n=1 Tax=Clostridium estertheticum TaxID=238834 RepID=UPI001C0C4369|nr:N-acetylmuramoyl-L-alanine amidase [Clostridium estertheticum]MBU3171337.1 N-acetylmuramoyl-L-alanine amidase [Clostridium estertheticum]
MEKIGTRGGHNRECEGASALINEVTEDRNVCAAMDENLKNAGDTVVNCTPGNCEENEDLNYGTDTANNNHVDLFVPIHFNKAYDSYVGAIGSEVWINPASDTGVAIGTRILNNLQALGFKNRGLKNGMHLHDVRVTNMPTVLVEVCFLEATEDVALYKKLGADVVGKAIADGINGKSCGNAPLIINKPASIVTIPETRVNNSIAQLQDECNRQGFSNQKVDGFSGTNTLAGCPLTKFGANGNITKWIQKRLGFPTNLQTGYFGDITKNAIIKYQAVMGLNADGIVGQGTWAALLR